MNSRKNSVQWLSFSMIALLFFSFSFLAVHPVLSSAGKISSVELNYDISKDLERSETEKDLNEETVNLFCFDISNILIQNPFFLLKRTQPVFSIPRVFYDIQLLPPESLIA